MKINRSKDVSLWLIYGICVANETDWRGICQLAVLLHWKVGTQLFLQML